MTPLCTARLNPCPLAPVPIDAHALWMLLRFSLWHAIERMHYDPADLCALLLVHAPQLPADQRRQFARQIREGLAWIDARSSGLALEFRAPLSYAATLTATAERLERGE